MNCEIYYTLNGKQMYCSTDSKQSFGDVAMKFHALMQNDVEDVEYTTTVKGKKVKKFRKKPCVRFDKSDYKLICISRASIFADQFAGMSSVDSPMDNVRKIANMKKKFSEEKEWKFPPRVQSILIEGGVL